MEQRRKAAEFACDRKQVVTRGGCSIIYLLIWLAIFFILYLLIRLAFFFSEYIRISFKKWSYIDRTYIHPTPRPIKLFLIWRKGLPIVKQKFWHRCDRVVSDSEMYNIGHSFLFPPTFKKRKSKRKQCS